MIVRPNTLTPRRTLAPVLRRSSRPFRSGFTLTEVLISMALVAVLLVGLGRIFQITSDTIKTGQAYQTALRKQKAVYTALSKDFLGYASNGNVAESDNGSGILPISKQVAIVINMNRVTTFLNQSRVDISATTNDSDDQGTRSATIRASQGRSLGLIGGLGEFNFRVDSIGFFGSGDFVRQTAPQLTSGELGSLRSTEAFIWYGHARLYNYSGIVTSEASYSFPGTGTVVPRDYGSVNRSNRYAEQFVLARHAILLREGTTRGSSSVLYGDDGLPQAALTRNAAIAGGARSTVSGWTNTTDNPDAGSSLANYLAVWAPLAAQSAIGNSTSVIPGQFPVVDVADTSATTYRNRIIDLLKTNPLWRNVRVGSPTRPSWWVNLYCSMVDRPMVNPFPARPLDPTTSSLRNPLLADGCSQFIVEFAGDFVAQDASGDTTTNGPDGVLDYVVIAGRRQTRWYGLPRDVNGDGVVLGKTSATDSPVAGNTSDVVPVRDVIRGSLAADDAFFQSYNGNRYPTGLGGRGYQFERVTPIWATGGNYMNVTADGMTGGGGRDVAFQYLVAFGPEEFEGGIAGVTPPASSQPPVTYSAGTRAYGDGAPKVYPQLIRVIVEMRDPAGALLTPVTQEYVFPVPQQ